MNVARLNPRFSRFRFAFCLTMAVCVSTFSSLSHAADDFGGAPQRILEKIEQKDFKAAFLLLISENSKERDKVVTPETETALDGVLKIGEDKTKDLGAFVDTDLYKVEYFGSRNVQLTYIVNYVNKSMVVVMKLFKPADVWKPRNLTWTPGVDDLIAEVHGVPKKKE